MHFLSFVYVTLSVEQDSGLSSMEWVSFTSLVSGPNLIAHLQHWLLATIRELLLLFHSSPSSLGYLIHFQQITFNADCLNVFVILGW